MVRTFLSIDIGFFLKQVDLMNFRVEHVRPRSGRASDEVAVLNKQDEGLFRKSAGQYVCTD